MVKLELYPSRLLSQMAVFVILSLIFIKAVLCYESSGSSELNRVEFTPLYETIIYSDIADIIKDYENNLNSPLEAFVNNEDSESDENIDDLLAEYQRYLDKAHKQRRNYVEKSKSKNKVPLVQRDRYTKSRAAQTNKHDDYYNVKYYNPGTFPFPKSQINAPLDFLIPINMMRSNLFNNFGEVPKSQVDSVKQFSADDISPDTKVLRLPPTKLSPMRENIQSSCYCEADTFPCDCGCKQCLIAFEPIAHKKQTDDAKQASPSSKAAVSDSSHKDLLPMTDNTINIRIKVDVQFPQVQQSFGEILKNKSNEKLIDRSSFSKESNINVPFPFFNFPYPLEMYGLKKPNKSTAPIHKITIHRKKKSKANSIGKKHRKKLITFHDLKIEQQHSTQPSLDENYNMSDYTQTMVENSYQISQANETSNLTQKVESKYPDKTTNNTKKLTSVNNTNTNDNIYVMVNIKNSADNTTEDPHRNENSIETDFARGIINVSTAEPSLRQKREAASPVDLMLSGQNTSYINSTNAKTNDTTKKTIKSAIDDVELLYWPNNSNGTLGSEMSITSLIIDTENNKEKMNMSTEAIRHDRSKALEEAVFGKVDWNDVGTVAPVFMSFMGKYIRGVLTFCSDTVCHSMKCAEKMCVHRTCAPTDRTNNKGHCAGSDTTDTVASLESIMDLPSNIALEIVDILQQKMLGKLFGKATLCIGLKCITFTASKKTFYKVKCTPKELDSAGYCLSTKVAKVA